MNGIFKSDSFNAVVRLGRLGAFFHIVSMACALTSRVLSTRKFQKIIEPRTQGGVSCSDFNLLHVSIHVISNSKLPLLSLPLPEADLAC